MYQDDYSSITSDLDTHSIQIYLSVFFAHNKLGAAFYDSTSAIIYFIPDVEETSRFDITQQILADIQPSMVICSAKTSDEYYKALNEHLNIQIIDPNNTSTNTKLQLIPQAYFHKDTVERTILTLKSLYPLTCDTDEKKRAYISAKMPFNIPNTLSAIGGLLPIIEERCPALSYEFDFLAGNILALRPYDLNALMIVHPFTFRALEIFNPSFHPSIYKANTTNNLREVNSLFAFLKRCVSSIGNRKLRSWCLKPCRSPEILQRRYDVIQFFLDPNQYELLRTLRDHLKSIVNIPSLLRKVFDQNTKIAVWKQIIESMRATLRIRMTLVPFRMNTYFFDDFCAKLTDDLPRLMNIIETSIDLQRSIRDNRIVFIDPNDPDLEQLRQDLIQLNEKLHQQAEFANNLLLQCGFESSYALTQDNGTLLIKGDKFHHDDLIWNDRQGQIWRCRTREMNVTTQEAEEKRKQLLAKELAIKRNLSLALRDGAELFVDATEFCSQLDCLLSFALIAYEQNNYTRPELIVNNRIEIIDGKHPLLPITTVVPNSYISDGNSNQANIHILTGFNCSGKTIYIKQIGLLVYMAQIGCFVPANKMRLGLMDKLFVKIHTDTHLTMGVSNFLRDLFETSFAVAGATGRSLVLMDEFGIGTNEIDGTALLASLITIWSKSEQACPHVIISTHFHDLIQQRLVSISSRIRCKTMETMYDDDGKLVYLYRIIDGLCTRSQAFSAALIVGLPDNVVRRANELLDKIENNQILHPIRNFTDMEEMVDLVEKAVQVNVNDNNQVIKFFQYLHHMIYKHIPCHRNE
ncbi:unnamed protein product [Rotaria sordida]|uniref:Uncharacterized protein n=1 Tax=Rotaria sordida TaxID=392033 RepID=A0A814NHG7_9BILA|nr:unnamed protein product [Rotaria sordida]CAF0913927.1 unnamed protein product [Rotaria sordida]CAF0967388.1 unnamed protein product [Rotaria sordida]CAF1090564.1 unnamed protein product [Rotaria sordida]CAF3543663.1 unnamed protein product [Rotaria sordida]